MSVCAVLLVKDEADVIEWTIRHLLGEVDEIVVADNLSTDRTRDILEELRLSDAAGVLDVRSDPEVGYRQSEKTTALARDALARGHRWVLPCDADEWWYSTDGRPIREFLEGLGPDAKIASAELYHHIPTADDPPASCSKCGGRGFLFEPLDVEGRFLEPVQVECDECFGRVCPNPFVRIGWRKRERDKLGKVAARLHPELRIEMGNHGAYLPGPSPTVGGLCVRHFGWRSPEQYVKKIRNGAAAYAAAPDLARAYGGHWQMFGNPPNEDAVAAHFVEWFFSREPGVDSSLIYDPAP